ncbi:MAG TPA: hypothetical protein DDW54_03415 [Clostridiales bacterium]|nr:hypothetical protein [Clostridiales bacterium]
MKNVLVFFGGASSEHDVSVVTGVMTANCLGGKYNAVPVYIDRENRWFTGDMLKDLSWYKTENFKAVQKAAVFAGDPCLYAVKKNRIKPLLRAYCAINCLHGLNGEDGSLAGILRLSGIPFASPSIFSSAASMDKYSTKIALKGIGVKTLRYVKADREEYYADRAKVVKETVGKIGLPLIVKPSNLGSSIGITLVKSEEELFDAFDLAFRFDASAIVEVALENFREINCACYRSDGKCVVSETEEPVSANDILTFEDKYGAGAERKFPADIPENVSGKIKKITEDVYRKLGFTGVIRIDYLLKDGVVYLNEINSVPGSLAYYLFTDSTENFSVMLGELIEEGIKEHNKYKSNVFSYGKSNLSFSFGKGGTKGGVTKK